MGITSFALLTNSVVVPELNIDNIMHFAAIKTFMELVSLPYKG